MNLIRLLVIVAIIWLSYRMYLNWKAKQTKNIKQRKNQTTIKNMVQCEKCGVHIPEYEAISSSGKFFCSKEHLN